MADDTQNGPAPELVQEALPASSRPRAPTGTNLKPPGEKTQEMSAIRFKELEQQLDEQRALEAQAGREEVIRWFTSVFLAIGLAAIVVRAFMR